MHAHLEIILPSGANIEQDVATLMEPFCEILKDGEEDEDAISKYAFWDWYTIGGRWSGNKVEVMIDKKRMADFRKELVKRKIMVSTFQAGKPSITTPEQVQEVDELWRSWFPKSRLDNCPLFAHSQGKNIEWPNIMLLSEVLRKIPDLGAERVMIGKNYTYDDGPKLRCSTMQVREVYNGSDWQRTSWDGKVKSALELHRNDRYPEYERVPSDLKDWVNLYMPNAVVVTVDYHS